jgi:hypothetical protein
MTYAIDLLERGRSAATEYWAGGFDAAKEHAENAILTGCAERVEIRDERGKLLFHYPRTMRASRS